MQNLIYQLILFILFIIIFSILGFYLAIRPFRIISAITPESFNLNYENITFRTEDNITLNGWFIQNNNPHAKTIILLHGYPADKGNVLPAMLFLHKKYNLFLFDFRYFGNSGGHYSTIGKTEVLDLLAAIQFLHSKGINEVGLWGFSMGGAVAIMTAPQAPEIKAIVAESSYADLNSMLYNYYRIPLLHYPLGWMTHLWARVFLGYDIGTISPTTAAKSLHIPILIIHSKQDDVIPFEHGLMLQKALSHNKKAKFLFIDKLTHGQMMQNHNQVILKFFEKNMK